MKLVKSCIYLICLLLINLIYASNPFVPIALGSTAKASIFENEQVNYHFVTNTDVDGITSNQKKIVLQQEVCGDLKDNDLDGIADEGCPVQQSSAGNPASNFSTSKTLRLGVVGDVDSNQGFTKQLEIANHYNVQVMIIPGDFEYSNGKEVLSALESHGFTKENTDIVVGNHDSSKETESWLDQNSTFGQVKLGFVSNKLALFNVDENINSDCSSPQFKILKSQIESSTALYKFVVVHQPFVTVKSTHTDNGQFDCYHPVFREGKIDGVLQAHNHNYQRFNIDGLLYGVFGTGTHDTGSNMYPLKSDTWGGNQCIKCITGKNGITVIDLHFNNEQSKNFAGWFIGMDNQILDAFDSSTTVGSISSKLTLN